MPEDYKRRLFAVDFGFTYDPTAIVEIRYSDGQYWIEEIVYKPGLHNSDIFKILKALAGPRDQIIADSSEPKSIDELRKLGLRILPAQKGPDSINYGIDIMQSFTINVTTRSVNTIKELRNYSYQKTRDGDFIDKPVDNWNHSIDAIRYALMQARRQPNPGVYHIS